LSSEANSILNQTLLGDAWANAELATLVVDELGRYIAANKSACTLTGYTSEELKHLRAGRDLAGDTRSAEIYAALAHGQRMQGKKLIRRKDGHLVSCRYWGIRTTVSRLPYFIMLLWPRTQALESTS
jgi:PAS domain S-box-containing protein